MDAIAALGLGAAGKVAYDIAGPFVRELGEMLKDRLKPYRAANQVKILERTARMVADAEATVKPVPPKLLVPILEHGSLEEDEDLQTMWSALLANAAIEKNDGREVSPAFPEVLRQLSSRDAFVLNRLFDIECQKTLGSRAAAFDDEIRPEFPEFTTEQIYDALHNLVHFDIVSFEVAKWDNVAGGGSFSERQYYITPFGGRFVHACRAPRKKES